MTNTATYNQNSILTLERTVQNVIDKYAADVIPLNDLCYNWTRLHRMFDTTLRQFEQYVPTLKWYIAPKTREFVMPDDCQEVRSAVLYTPGIIWTDMPLLNLGYDYTYNKFQNTVNSYLMGLAVQYLAKYSTSTQSITTDEQYISSDGITEFDIEYVPNPKTIKLVADADDEYEMTISHITPDTMQFKFNQVGTSYDTLSIDLSSMRAIVDTSIDADTFVLKYTTKFEAINGLDSGAEFFEMMFASRLLSGIGNAKAVCKFNSMPNDITADNLNGIAAKLEEEVEKYTKSKWWLGIAAIN